MLKSRVIFKRLLPSAITAVALVFAGSISYLLAQTASQKGYAVTTPGSTIQTATGNPEGSGLPNSDSATQPDNPASNSNPGPTASRASGSPAGSATATPAQSAPVASNPAAPSQPPTQSLTVSVNINGSSGFQITLPPGSNHCDVLNQALSEGKISQLFMRYNSSYGSYGVYQINGLGQENQVWWTYSVNGRSPPAGCSQIKVNNNDDVTWTYVGP